MGEIAAAAPVLVADLLRHDLRLAPDRLGEDVGEPLRVGDLQHLDPRLAGLADDLDDRAREAARARCTSRATRGQSTAPSKSIRSATPTPPMKACMKATSRN